MDPIESHVPHRGAMLLLDRLVEVDEAHAVAEVVVPADGLFVRDGRMPAWVGIEYMAQTVSAWSGGRARREGAEPKVGFLLGSRRFESRCPDFPAGAVLRIEARHEFIGLNGLGLFDCRILQDGVEVASARLSTFEPEDGPAYLKNSASAP
jgi:predicted hotdog family 3-hydroxylacyl-ACP dehydratase